MLFLRISASLQDVCLLRDFLSAALHTLTSAAWYATFCSTAPSWGRAGSLRAVSWSRRPQPAVYLFVRSYLKRRMLALLFDNVVFMRRLMSESGEGPEGSLCVHEWLHVAFPHKSHYIYSRQFGNIAFSSWTVNENLLNRGTSEISSIILFSCQNLGA